MRKLLTVILGSVFLVATIPSASAKPSLERQAWYDACHFSRYKCFGVQMPRVSKVQYLDNSGVYGVYYLGSDVVFVATNLEPGLARAVMAHEMTHYLQVKVGGFVPDMGANCLLESEAFGVSDQVLDLYPELRSLKRNGSLSGYNC